MKPGAFCDDNSRLANGREHQYSSKIFHKVPGSNENS
jgi:hypothetical protein